MAHGATAGAGKQSRTAQLAKHTPKVTGSALNVEIYGWINTRMLPPGFK